MGKLTYGMNVSVDGYIADTNGDIGWSDPDAELHQYWNDQLSWPGATRTSQARTGAT